jgi:hypothetical protein
VELELISPSKASARRTAKAPVAVEPGDLVLVLVGHELEEVARDRLGQGLVPGRLGRLRRPDGRDEAAVAVGVGLVLVTCEESGPAGDQLVEARRRRRPGGRAGQSLDGRRVVGVGATPGERPLVEVDGLAVDLDRPEQRLARDRDEALLPGPAEEEEVGGDAVAQERLGCRVASTKRVRPSPAAAAIRRRSAAPGKTRSGLRAKSPVTVSSVSTTTVVAPLRTASSACPPAATTRSHPSNTSAPPAAIRVLPISSWRRATFRWVMTAPPFWATPVMSRLAKPLPSR